MVNVDSKRTSWLRHNDVTEGQKYSLTESRLETETNIHNLENPSLEIFFVSISGNERKFPYEKLATVRVGIIFENAD